MNAELRLLLSAGRGPAECDWVVAQLTIRLERDALRSGVAVERLEIVPGGQRGTFRSVLLGLAGPDAERFARSWTGTLCWQAPSPYRPGPGRKNWFVIADRQDGQAAEVPFSEDDVEMVPCRTGGPGGQHRDKAGTAVRATHRPTGVVVVVDTERRLTDNRRLALTLLRERYKGAAQAEARVAIEARHLVHGQLVRGNAVRTEVL